MRAAVSVFLLRLCSTRCSGMQALPHVTVLPQARAAVVQHIDVSCRSTAAVLQTAIVAMRRTASVDTSVDNQLGADLFVVGWP